MRENEEYTAHTQYCDFEGTVAVDSADQNLLTTYFQEQGLIDEGVVPEGFGAYILKDAVKNKTVFNVSAYIQKSETELHEIQATMDLDEFFQYFKRFRILVSREGKLTGSKFNIIEQE